MDKNNMTAVEWLEQQLLSHTKIENSKYIQQKIVDIAVWQLDTYLEQAKQMEKEQIIKAYNAYYSQEAFIDGEYLKGEQYYNETYVQEKEYLKESTCEYSGLPSVQSYEDPKK